MAATAPSIGRIVHYRLSEDDAEQIRIRRLEWSTKFAHDLESSTNVACAGDVYPAIVVRVWEPESPDAAINLRVMLDGVDDFWATSRVRGDGETPGRWSWPKVTIVLNQQGTASAF